MNQSIDEKILDSLRDYHLGKLDGVEKQTIEQQIIDHPEYRDALHHMATVYDILDVKIENGLREYLKKLQTNSPAIEIKIERPRSFPWKWAAAASVLVLLSVAGLKYSAQQSFINERLERYTSIDASTRGENKPVNHIEDLKTRYQDNPDQLIDSLKSLPADHPLYFKAQTEIASQYIGLKKYNEALPYLRSTEKQSPESGILKLLCLMKLHQTGEEFNKSLDIIMNDPTHIDSKEARTIYDHTKTFWWKVFN